MKHSAAKSLGVAALGAAFAAVGAGSASAVVPGLPDAAATVGTVTSAVPLEQVAQTLPAGGAQSLAAGQQALTERLASAPQALPSDGSDPVGSLLGGLPVAKGGVPVQGLPLGG